MLICYTKGIERRIYRWLSQAAADERRRYIVSHWLGAYLNWSLPLPRWDPVMLGWYMLRCRWTGRCLQAAVGWERWTAECSHRIIWNGKLYSIFCFKYIYTGWPVQLYTVLPQGHRVMGHLKPLSLDWLLDWDFFISINIISLQKYSNSNMYNRMYVMTGSILSSIPYRNRISQNMIYQIIPRNI